MLSVYNKSMLFTMYTQLRVKLSPFYLPTRRLGRFFWERGQNRLGYFTLVTQLVGSIATCRVTDNRQSLMLPFVMLANIATLSIVRFFTSTVRSHIDEYYSSLIEIYAELT